MSTMTTDETKSAGCCGGSGKSVGKTDARETDVRDDVAKAYARAISQSMAAKDGGRCCAPPSAEAVAAQTAGYGDAEKESFPEAAQSSFGCGNPLAFAGVEPGDVVLDLGSGAGLDLLIAAEKVGPEGKAIGIDMTDEMIAAAEKNIERAGQVGVAEIRKGHIEELPVEDASVDWVISNCVINLSPDKAAVFKEIARVLKPGGHFSVSDIVVDELPAWVRKHEAAYAACVAGAISEAEYLEGLENAGLVDVEVTERYVYDGSQIKAMVEVDLANFDLDSDIAGDLASLTGSVASVKVVGRRAPA